MSRLIGVVYVVLALFCSGPAVAEHSGRNVWRTSSGRLCVDNTLAVRKMKVGGALGTVAGSDARGIFVALPVVSDGGSEDGITVFVRKAGRYEPALPAVDYDSLQPVEHVPGLGALPRDERLGLQRFVAIADTSEPGRFDATCLEISAHCKCSRHFQYRGLAGSYSFECGEIARWNEFEALVVGVMDEDRIAVCKKHISIQR